jgi:hypothetical protein
MRTLKTGCTSPGRRRADTLGASDLPEVPGQRRLRAGLRHQDSIMPSVYQLRAVLRDVSPLIWRRLQVRSDTSIGALHAFFHGSCTQFLVLSCYVRAFPSATRRPRSLARQTASSGPPATRLVLSRRRPTKHLAVELPWQRLSIVGNQVATWRLVRLLRKRSLAQRGLCSRSTL